jgi:GntR family transcriptional regulator
MVVSVNVVDSRPLYAQVRETLLERIKSGQWKPGQIIPNEFDVAAEFNVSQGTARKAIDTLAADGLVVRRQGRGTFVVEHTPADMLFRFFQLYFDDGTPIKPSSPVAGRPMRSAATATECAALDIAPGAAVIRIERTRFASDRPLVHETIVLPDALYPGLADEPDVPNTLYDLFQRTHGHIIIRADERITPIAAEGPLARTLEVDDGVPLLRIERIAFGLDEQRLEWRISVCHLAGAHYFARLK